MIRSAILTQSLILSHNGHRFISPTQLQPHYYYRKKPKQTLDDALLLLLSRPLDCLEEEEEEEPTNEAFDQPSVTTVDSDAKYGEDSKSTVAAACSRGCCWCGSRLPIFRRRSTVLSDSAFLCNWAIRRTGSGTFFSIFFRFGYEILYIEFFGWIGLDLILVLFPFCFRFLGSPWKCLFSQFLDIFFFLFFFSLFWITEITKDIDLNFVLLFLILTK